MEYIETNGRESKARSWFWISFSTMELVKGEEVGVPRVTGPRVHLFQRRRTTGDLTGVEKAG